MAKFRFAKLVRDKIVEHQIASGATPKYHQLSLDEHKNQLVQKIIEEVQEISTARPQELEMEIADVQQALDDLKKLLNLTDEDISKAQFQKNKKNGAFEKGFTSSGLK